MLERLNALWFGSSLGYLEQLSIRTALALGHPYTLYSYEPGTLAGVPAGVELRDAREVMDDPRRTKYFQGNFKALGSDFFRYELLAKGLGYWVDLDLVFVRPLRFNSDYVYGWEKPGSINGAVLKVPAGSEMLEAMRAVPEQNWCPPFYGPRRRLRYYMRRLRGPVGLDQLDWGAAGPELITYLAKKTGHADAAQSVPVFYPLDYDQAPMLFGPAEDVEALIRPDTRTVHMWHSRLTPFLRQPPPAGSYIERLCREHDVSAPR